jgi:carbohydrate binding protein with CBM4/9 domain
MALTRAVKGRVDEAVAQIHGHFGETVYVRRLSSSDPDDTYSEDMTRVEAEFRLLAVVNVDVPRRTLDRFGVVTPVDLMVTFAKDLMDEVGLDYLHINDVIIWRGRRHTVVQVNEVPKAVIEDVNDTNDTESEFIELAVFAVISEVPEYPPEVPVTPVDPDAAAVLVNPSFESGTTGWTFNPTADATTLKASDGVRSYHQIPTAKNQFTTQDLTGKLVPGKTYTIDSEAFAVNGVPTLKATVGDDDYVVTGDPAWIGDGVWHQMPQLSFTAPTDPDTPVILSVGQGDVTDPGEFYLDTLMADAPAEPVDPPPVTDPTDPVPSPVSALQRAEFIAGQYVVHLLFNKDIEFIGSPALVLRITVNHELAYFGGITLDNPRRITVLIDQLLKPTDEVLVYYNQQGKSTIQNGIVLASNPAQEIADFDGVRAERR